jgi:heavy metal translocating P-type ATPase
VNSQKLPEVPVPVTPNTSSNGVPGGRKHEQPLIQRLWDQKQLPIAALAVIGIAAHLFLWWTGRTDASRWPLYVVLGAGGGPLVADLVIKMFRLQFGSDLLAGISIVTAIFLNEYLAGALVVLMLSGGEALESYAVRRASSVLESLAGRMPKIVHREVNGQIADAPSESVAIGDMLVIYPHEACPADGTVLAGHAVMDESFLTGEPYHISKSPGSQVISGAINGESVVKIRADKLPVDSRYAKIVKVMEQSSQQRPQIRRLGDQLGAVYTPVAVAIAVAAWWFSGQADRFLAVLVIATPCPLLIAIPVAIIGAISLAAKQGIIVRDPAVLERIGRCRTAIFDKTGTLTYGRPLLTEQLVSAGNDASRVLQYVASLEQYSKHPLSTAIVAAAEDAEIKTYAADSISEKPGEGLSGVIDGHRVRVTSRNQLIEINPQAAAELPGIVAGLECVVLIDDQYAATYRFRDEPRGDGASFVQHLRPKHAFKRVLIVSGDRESEVRYLAKVVGITDVFAEQSPEQKLDIVRRETRAADTVYLGDGINDAPALLAATVGLAFGQHSEITSEAAGAVIMDSSLTKVDELLHIGIRMRRIALQSAVGGMALSVIGMLVATTGMLPPVAGAVSQEVIDVFAVLNALRVSMLPKSLTDL